MSNVWFIAEITVWSMLKGQGFCLFVCYVIDLWITLINWEGFTTSKTLIRVWGANLLNSQSIKFESFGLCLHCVCLHHHHIISHTVWNTNLRYLILTSRSLIQNVPLETIVSKSRLTDLDVLLKIDVKVVAKVKLNGATGQKQKYGVLYCLMMQTLLGSPVPWIDWPPAQTVTLLAMFRLWKEKWIKGILNI